MKNALGMGVEAVFWAALLFIVYLLMEDVRLHEPWTTEERFALALAGGLIAFGVWVS